ncbi:hypothetical protein HDV02_000954, partial [Globomyces sp. JEL0801]
MSTKSCVCKCCQGRGCSPVFVGNIMAKDSSQCLATSCTGFYPVQCKKDLQLGGAIQADFDQNANRGTAIAGWILIAIVVGVIAVVAGFCYFCISRSRKQKQYVDSNNIVMVPPQQPYQNQPVYQPPSYPPPQQPYDQKQNASNQQPAYGQPAYGQPAYGQPVYGQSTYNPPPVQKPYGAGQSGFGKGSSGVSPLAAGAVGAVGGLAAGA